jgi:SET domain-containing protein
MEELQEPLLQVRESPGVGRGARGVFAAADIAAGQTLEVAPVIVIPRQESQLLSTTRLEDYVFKWGGGCYALALGYGSLYNHSYTPNARYVQDTAARAMRFLALRAILRGEEITINYNGRPDAEGDVWFPVAPI